MATEDLKRFMVERLLDLDPTLNDESGAAIYSKVIDPLVLRLGSDPMAVDIESFIIQRLQDEFPELDVVTPGSALRDVLVSPLVLILEPLRREIEFLKTQQSLSKWQALTETEMDAILSNIFSVRMTGSYAYGAVRLYFSTPATLSLDASVTFFTASGQIFSPEDPVNYSPSDYTRAGNLYYIDVEVRSTDPNSFNNVPKDTIKFTNGLDGVVRVTNPNSMSGGVTEETNEDFLNRAERSLSERSLNTKRGIETNLFNNFEDIVSIDVVGFGEPDMQRDILQGDVNVDLTEVPGPLVYMTADWSTLNAVSGVPLPFTNMFFLEAPAGGWDPELLIEVKGAKFVRVSDGHRNFDDTLLGRVRRVDLTYHDLGDDRVYFKLTDFDVYPKPANIFAEANVATAKTDGERSGLNSHAAQGSEYKLFGEKDDVEYVRGAHLPFTDTIDTTFDPAMVPRGLLGGKDFLVVLSKSMGAVDAGHVFSRNPDLPSAGENLLVDWSSRIRMYPLLKFHTATSLGIGRVDGLMTSKDRVIYKGQNNFEFVPDLNYSGLRETISLVDFGGPALVQEDENPNDGVTLDDFSRNPGIMLESALDGQTGPYSVPDPSIPAQDPTLPTAEPFPLDLVLHPSLKSWAERRVQNGHFVSCAVYTDTFDGRTNQINDNLIWTGWGKVIGVGMGNPSRLRVEGMDFLPLQINNMGGWSPGASMSVQALSVPFTPFDDFQGDPLFNWSDRVMNVRMKHLPVPSFTDHIWVTADGPWSGEGTPASVGIYLTQDNLHWPCSSASGNLTFRVRIDGEVVFSWDGNGGAEDLGFELLTSWSSEIDRPSIPLAGVGMEDMDPNINQATIVGGCTHFLAGEPQCSCTAIHMLKIIADGIRSALTLDPTFGNERNLPYRCESRQVEDGDGNIMSGGLRWNEATQAGRVVIQDRRWNEAGNSVPIEVVRYDPDPANAVPPNSLDPNSYAEMPLTIEGAHPNSGDPFLILVDEAESNQAEFTGGVTPSVAALAERLGDFIEAAGHFAVSSWSPADNQFTIIATPAFAGNTLNETSFLYETAAGVDQGELNPSLWDGAPQANGGFWGGFGPLAQVVGNEHVSLLDLTSAAPHLYGQLSDAGYEEATVTTSLSGSETRVLVSLGNTPVAYPRCQGDPAVIYQVHIIVEYTFDLGGPNEEERRAVYMDDGIGNMVEAASNVAMGTDGWLDVAEPQEINYAAGVVLLNFNSADTLPGNASFYASYTYYSTPYKAFWTVYEGQRELISPDGHLLASYDDFAFAPAYKRPAHELTVGNHVSGAVHARGPSGYRGDGWQSEDFESMDPDTGDFRVVTSADVYGEATETADLAVHNTHTNFQHCFWLRLGKGVDIHHPSIGGTPSALCMSAEFVNLDTLGLSIVAPQHKYSLKRYATVINSSSIQPLNVDGAGGDDTLVVQPLSAPFSEGANSIKRPGDDDVIEVDTTFSGLPNVKGSQGFLLPHPMGANYDGTSLANESLQGTTYESGDLLEHQVVQLFQGMDSEIGDETITISGIPGGVPFNVVTFIPVEVESDKVHIGGLTDVYVQPGSLDEETTGGIKLQPEDPTVGLEVVVIGNDGSIDPSVEPSHFYSLTLASALSAELDQIAPAPANNLVLEILFSPSDEIQPAFVRIVHSLIDGCKIDGGYPVSLGAGFTDLKFRVLRQVSTNLFQPLIVLQQGNDLVTNANEMSAFTPGGFDLGTINPANISVWLSVDSDANKGEYLVTGQNLNSLFLDRVMEETATALSYRLYIKQDEKVDAPLVKIKEVSLSGDAAGILVPYKHPVDVVASSFAGLNDDPLNQSSFGREGGVLSTAVINGVPVCVFDIEEAGVGQEEQTDFVFQGVVRYDVLRLEDLDGALKYFYVTGFGDVDLNIDGNVGVNNRLVLDRLDDLPPGGYSELRFTVGHPAIGKGRVYFTDPTFFEVGPDTKFNYTDPETDKIYHLRPSPAEHATIFESEKLFTDVKVTVAEQDQLISEEIDFFKHGILPGDKLEIITKVLLSENYDGDAALLENENVNVAGKTLVFRAASLTRTVTFGGPNPRTLDNVAADINNQVGDIVRASVVTTDTVQPYYALRLASGFDLEILTSGSIGILSDLRLTQIDNTPTTAPGNELILDCFVRDLEYIPIQMVPAGDKAKTIIRLMDEDGLPFPIPYMSAFPPGHFEELFIKVSRVKYQRVFPGDLLEDPRGMFYKDITLTSYDPNDVNGVVPEDVTLVPEEYTSLGYEVTTDNTNYTFSVGENSYIRTTPVVLDLNATSFKKVYEAAAATVAITYTRSQTVADIQAYMLTPNTRVVCHNPLVRHFFPAYPLMSIKFGGSLTEERVKEKVGDFLVSLYPNRPLTLYELQARLTREGVGYLALPQEASFVLINKDRTRSVARDKNVVTLGVQYHYMSDLSWVNVEKVR